ncbi:hypothetical protein EGT74_06605 [Chitinophaga lutea]|uniref:Uncharacterized protein n=1 Tax=Chitinophaga lutea TaxID=2488634 RepID=A0A3N4QB36_9BACT|nr:hypothetical protein [Chitinophaga lutea]RPE13197.1 hypothetical protein EGT74_06605 [Chitinophaga lutea]
MNVNLISRDILPAIYRKMRPSPESDDTDIVFRHGCHFVNDAMIAAAVHTWYRLHVETYCIISNVTIDVTITPTSLITNGPPPSTIQFVKWLRHLKECLDIDLIDSRRYTTNDEVRFVTYLDDILYEAMWCVISSLPAYTTASNGTTTGNTTTFIL